MKNYATQFWTWTTELYLRFEPTAIHQMVSTNRFRPPSFCLEIPRKMSRLVHYTSVQVHSHKLRVYILRGNSTFLHYSYFHQKYQIMVLYFLLVYRYGKHARAFLEKQVGIQSCVKFPALILKTAIWMWRCQLNRWLNHIHWSKSVTSVPGPQRFSFGLVHTCIMYWIIAHEKDML